MGNARIPIFHWRVGSYEKMAAYFMFTPSFLLQEENEDTENKIEIPVNTEIQCKQYCIRIW